MSYGIQILNADGRVQVDDRGYAPNTYLKSISAQAYTAMSYPPANYVTGDLVIARPASNSPTHPTAPQTATTGSATGDYIPMARHRNNGDFYGSDNTPSTEYQNTAGIVTGLVRSQYGNIAAPAAIEYGLDIYSDNSTTDVIFSATRSTSVSVLAQGVLTQGSSITYTPPSTLSWDKIYAVMNGTEQFWNYGQAAVLLPSFGHFQGYEFYPNASTPYIKMIAETTLFGQQIGGMVGGEFSWMIIHDPN